MSSVSPLLAPIQLSYKRRNKPRRRPLAHVDQVESHSFDQLPWISALDTPQDSSSPWDIADLSQIPDLPGPGPVRRRKTSLRSNPLALPPLQTQFPNDSSWVAGPTFPFCDTPISRSQTPQTRFTPSRVLFRNLMPVYNDHPDNCPSFASPCHIKS
ncbi:hypothetical protein L208DRAFT_1401967 [Tricholoma matsutake]|nr:hypothetical protein L208DRAFT_1401967 [Tricholoma matsutake 945]